MSDTQLRDRVHDVLNQADESSESIVAGDDEAAEDGESTLLETAAEASDVLESAEPDELLAAIGLDTLADGTEPDSIPEAIARGEEENVADLRRLLRLSNLADHADDGGLEDAVDGLRAAIGERADAASESGASADEADDEPATDDGEAGTSDGETGDGSETSGDVGDRLRAAMSDSFAEFGDELSELKTQLEERSAAAADGETAGEEADAADEDEDEDETDDGLLERRSGGEDRGTASGRPSRHSTMAPPPSRRADMRGTARHSTMPNKRG
ncbi:hypothetical protein [Natrinema sp. 1APR25-10V2]|uniref:hypothetical protein n=1 Tax=Natrinema sp. 1APR25-10V2 TaxID=2951081 RepID=UPI002876C1AB|nr:hypothetical protein [Natrinema sp. 1APR25-10V2]MDS0474098.1 hypothetical protein [Natrinema sp. 1APR25-10V2]